MKDQALNSARPLKRHNQNAIKLHSRRRSYLIASLAVFSIGYTIYDWSLFSALGQRLGEVAILGTALFVTELAFVVGAVMMLASIGRAAISFPDTKNPLNLFRHLHKHIGAIARQSSSSRLFGIGFWLNFIGAVGTTVLLAAGVVLFLPLPSQVILLVLLLDLAATLGWRVPLQMSRRQQAARDRIIVRQANAGDIDAYIALQTTRWSKDNQAQRKQLLSRYNSFPGGMMVAEKNNTVVGMVYAIKIRSYNYDDPPSWYDLTNNGMCDTHDSAGSIIFGVDLSTAKGVGGLAGDKLLLGIAQLAIRENCQYCILGGRMPGYHKYSSKMTAHDYLWARSSNGKFLDRQVQYYSQAGLRIIKELPDYFKDPESCDYGVLLQWRNPFYNLRGRWFWSRVFPWLYELEQAYGVVRRRLRSR